MKYHSSLLPVLATAFAWSLPCEGATLLNWTIDGLVNTQFSQAENVSADKASSDYSVGIGELDLTGLYWAGANAYSGNGGNADGHLNLTTWQQTGNLGTPANYMSFTLNVGAGSSLILDTLSMDNYRNGAGAPSNGTWEYSIDGGLNYMTLGSNTLPTGSGSDQGYGTTSFLSGPLTIDNIASGEIIFRFAATGGTATSGNLHIRDITITGSLLPIPEPFSLSLTFLGLAPLVCRKRRP